MGMSLATAHFPYLNSFPQRVLLALFAAIVVAVAEAVLYLIWQSRRGTSKRVKSLRRIGPARHKKDDEMFDDGSDSGEKLETISSSVEGMTDGVLRHRH